MSAPELVKLLALAGFLAVVIPLVKARFSGWTALAKAYPAGEQPVGGAMFRRRSGQMKWRLKYDRCLRVIIHRTGIYVVPHLVFRLFHPPVLLPWREVQSVTEKRLVFFTEIMVRFEDQAGRKLTLSLPSDAQSAIREISGWRDFSKPT